MALFYHLVKNLETNREYVVKGFGYNQAMQIASMIPEDGEFAYKHEIDYEDFNEYAYIRQDRVDTTDLLVEFKYIANLMKHYEENDLLVEFNEVLYKAALITETFEKRRKEKSLPYGRANFYSTVRL